MIVRVCLSVRMYVRMCLYLSVCQLYKENSFQIHLAGINHCKRSFERTAYITYSYIGTHIHSAVQDRTRLPQSLAVKKCGETRIFGLALKGKTSSPSWRNKKCKYILFEEKTRIAQQRCKQTLYIRVQRLKIHFS